MRTMIQSQLSIVQPTIEHEHAKELELISCILDSDPKILQWVYQDITSKGQDPKSGREGMTADQVLRALILKQMNNFSYDKLAFHIGDSNCYRAFCHIGIGDKPPSRSTLQENIKRITPLTIESINRKMILCAKKMGIESGKKVRVDTTVVEANIHTPSDSSLLWDCVRSITRLIQQANETLAPLPIPFSDHRKRAKRRALGILNAKTDKIRLQLYKDLLKVCGKTMRYGEAAVVFLEGIRGINVEAVAIARDLAEKLRHVITLTQQVINQTVRRVIQEETVPAEEKVVSIFEPHTDIIVKDNRDTFYGHKVCLSSGKSGLILDLVVESGNPADSSLAVKMIERHEQILSKVPTHTAFDGGFASKDNLEDIKQMGVQNVMFHKRRGIPISQMTKSSWIYRQLRNFRAGIEGIISFLKRSFGMDRCTWNGEQSFKSYVWGSVLSANLLLMARHLMS